MAVISRKLDYADRFSLQQADQAIRKDVVRALVELITNSNDSYQRLEEKKWNGMGDIYIDLFSKREKSFIWVRDCAEGMTIEQMEKNVGTYAEETSGFSRGISVRGLWGRGLKDSIFGLGHGEVVSIKDDQLNHCWLEINKDKGKPIYKFEDSPRRASKAIRRQMQIISGNGTVVQIEVSRKGVKIPQFDNLRHTLEKHYELRVIMTNPKRKVVLRKLDAKNKIQQAVELEYKFPVGEKILDKTLTLTGYDAPAHITIFRSDIPLLMPSENKLLAEGGLLVVSKGIAIDNTLFKYSNSEYADKLYGKVECDYFHNLLSNVETEPVLTATRDGVNWDYPFCSALKKSVEAELAPIIETEKKRIESQNKVHINHHLRQKLNNVLKELNSIASMELGKIGNADGDGTGEKVPFVPESGFGFVPEYVYLQSGKIGGLLLRARVSEEFNNGMFISIESDNQEVTIIHPQVILQENKDYPSILEASVSVEGRQVGAEAIVSARAGVLEAKALVKVISKKLPVVEPPSPKNKGGLIKDIKFDPSAEPRHRVKFDPETSRVIIATKAPTVSAYFDETGNGQEAPAGQVMLAELITEAACREIARRGVQSGNWLSIEGSEADAVQREYINLQNKYAHIIHSCIVSSEHRRNSIDFNKKVGRPKKSELSNKIITEA
jgi:hypothetical protein